MRRWNLSHYATSSCVTAALLAGCGGSQAPIGAPGALPQTSALAAPANRTHYKVLYSFGAPPDGSNPRASLIDVGGTLYGTTFAGGANSCSYISPHTSCGTVFSITPSGAEKVLYGFGPPPDGDNPDAGLIDVGGTLYGTTSDGGHTVYSRYYTCGTVFSLTPSGAETVIYRFDGDYHDGCGPVAGLIDVYGTLYGTTYSGGIAGGPGCKYASCGSFYSVTTQGEEVMLHSFGGTQGGSHPRAGLIDVKGELYGTTSLGSKRHPGSVFRMTTGGAKTVLHVFKKTDGASPYASLLELNGKLYGTTSLGGAYNCSTNHKGCGTVFSIPPEGGMENVLLSFNGADGYFPTASLIELNGRLYGTTLYGGAYNDGTVFSITPSGKEKVLHSFGAGSDGKQPFAGLLDVNGTLYGTTSSGGTYNNGTVFTLKP
jgi:uncharacterized repeat protein (TIGR03803 family)